MRNGNITFIIFLAHLSFAAFAQTPTTPSLGYEWKLLPTMSDEFNDQTSLDTNKWHPRLINWGGRKPAEFLPENVFLDPVEGYLMLKNTIHPNEIAKKSMPGYVEPDYKQNISELEFTIAAAGIETVDTQTFGYYETRMKASAIRMSSTFWLNTTKVHYNDDVQNPDRASGCEGYATEIDVIECMGGGTPTGTNWPALPWDTGMASNTHFKLKAIKNNGNCGDNYLSEGASADVGENVADNFHTYGAWWVNSNIVKYYIDGALVNTVYPNSTAFATPMNVPMGVRLVTETYNWQIRRDSDGNYLSDNPGYPNHAELENDNINTTYYDYVRSYTLMPTANNLLENPDYETGSITPWEFSNQPTGGVEVTNTAFSKFNGEFGVKIDGQAYLKQIVPISPGKSYTLNVMGKNGNAASPSSLGIKTSDGTLIASKQISETFFKDYEINFDSTTNTSIEIFVFASANQSAYVDSFSLIEVDNSTLSNTSIDTFYETPISVYKSDDNKLAISTANTLKKLSVEIFDMTGTKIFFNENYTAFHGIENHIEIDNIVKGIYLIRLKDSKDVSKVFKVVL